MKFHNKDEILQALANHVIDVEDAQQLLEDLAIDRIRIYVGPKGVCCVELPARQFPISLYGDQWRQLLEMRLVGNILKFIDDPRNQVRNKDGSPATLRLG